MSWDEKYWMGVGLAFLGGMIPVLAVLLKAFVG